MYDTICFYIKRYIWMHFKNIHGLKKYQIANFLMFFKNFNVMMLKIKNIKNYYDNKCIICSDGT
jgi:hypothetical protein